MFSESASFQPTDHRVILTGIDMPFWSMVGQIVKIGIAAIPAIFIVSIIWVVMVGTVAEIVSFVSDLFR